MPPIRHVVTTAASPWQEAPAPVAGPIDGVPSVIVRTDAPEQTVEGFGACFSELGWVALQRASPADREAALHRLFAPGGGLDLGWCRMPIGANDYARDWYSYDETDGDLALERFSIAQDHETLVPFIRAAQAHRPDLALWASPWSPPSWMKRNGHYAAAMSAGTLSTGDNGLRPDQVGHEGTDMIRLEPEVLDAYARYFGRFVDAYAELGVPVTMVMPQNEFNSAQSFPSCTWTPEGLAAFLRRLGPEMARRGVEVFLGTLERPDPGLVDRVLADPEAVAHVAGVGFQWAGKGAAPFVHRDHPNLRLMQTEQECGDGSNDWRLARRAFALMRHAFTSGASAYLYWNIALGPGGASRWGWRQNSLLTVGDDGTITANHELHVLQHASHFVRPGARHLPTLSYTGHEDQFAFRNPDGTVVIVAQNPLGEPMPVTCAVDGRAVAATLPADSISTLVLPA